MGKKEERQVRLNITGLVDLLMDALMGEWMDRCGVRQTDRQRCRWASRQAGDEDREADIIANVTGALFIIACILI